MDILKALETIKETNPELVEMIKKELANKDAENARITKDKQDNIEMLKDLLTKTGAKDTSSLQTNIDKDKNDIVNLTNTVNALKADLEAKTKSEMKLKKDGVIVSQLKKYKIDENFDFMRDALNSMANYDDNGVVTIKDKTIETYLQEYVDSNSKIKGKTRDTSSSPNDDLFTKAEIIAMSEEEMIKYEEKLNRSISAGVLN